MELSVMTIGAFTFPYNPTNTTFKAEMKVGKHQYPLVNGCDIEVIGAEPIEVTCEGAFFKGMYSEDSTNPIDYFNGLYSVFKQGEIVSFSHPIFPDCDQCVITSLEGKVQPEEDVIHFTVKVLVDGTNSLYTIKTPSTNKSKTSTSSSSTKKTTVTYGTYKTTKKNQSLSSIKTAIKKKLSTTAKKNKITTANLNTWNPKLKGKWGKLSKGTAIKYAK